MELIDSALVPVMEERLAKATTPEAKERALLDLKVVDPAAGSGHFLLAAARRIGKELARVRTGEPEPAPEAQRAAIRDVVRHCLYAVDRNPLAVDLCKVALWIEGHNTGRPLSFLDHHVKLGDSLIGVFDLKVLEKGIPDDAYKPLTGDDKEVARELKKRNRQEREGQETLGLFGSEDLAAAEAGIARAARELEAFEDDSPAAVHEKGRRYRAVPRAARRLPAPAPGLRPLDRGVLRQAGEARSRRARAHPDHRPRAPGPAQPARHPGRHEDRARAGPGAPLLPLAARVPRGLRRRRLRRGARQPAVGANQAPGAGVLRQPRSARSPSAPNKAARERLIKDLPKRNPALAAELEQAKHAAEAASLFVRASGRFPLTAVGDVNTYALFAETFLSLPSKTGGPASSSRPASRPTTAPRRSSTR